MEMTEMLTPSILLSETHFPLLGIRGILADAIARIADERFFGCIELTTIADGNERRRIGQIVRENGLILNLWMSLVLAEEGLNLSALDESLRKRSVRRVADHIPQSTECGATALAVLSGPDPGPLCRAEASQRLCLSLCELSDAASAEGSLKVLLEPLDRGAHRNGLI
ncbi:MAG: TIM barrel protein, partial [Candidatus Zixiibacteriota bacterium]